MKVLVLYESSGVVRKAFQRKNCEAFSCDLLPADDGDTQFHIQKDAIELLNNIKTNEFDLIIAHPECTALSVSGNWVYAEGKPKHQERINSIKYVQDLWELMKSKAKHCCIENPVGVLYSQGGLPKPQYIQPYQFGHDASKKTGLTLHNLPQLKHTSLVEGRFVHGIERWANQTDSGQNRLSPSDDRWKLRARTYEGIADAMADQWSEYISKQDML